MKPKKSKPKAQKSRRAAKRSQLTSTSETVKHRQQFNQLLDDAIFGVKKS